MTVSSNEGVKYATKVWLMGVIGGPTILFSYFAVDELSDLAFLLSWGIFLFLITFLYSLVLSMPSWILICLCVTWVNRLYWSVFAKKCFLFGVATLFTILSFTFFAGSMYKDDYLIALSYWLSITFGIFYFNFQTPEPQVPDSLPDQSSQP